jgi:disulfide bond formation protein DsbB
MNFLKKFFLNIWFPHTRILWGLLFLGFIFYESCGLYFQYWLKLNPCIECVYERACFMFFGVAALIGVIIPRIMIMRLAASAVWLVSSVWGLIIAIEHRGYEIDYQKSLADPFASSTTCGFFANFPEYFKLDKWLPSVFQPTGVCGDASWNFAGLTMVQWIIIIFVCNAVVAGIVTLLSLVPFDKYKSWVITARHG